MALLTMNYFTIAIATVIAQLGLVASTPWAGNTGQCVVEPQPGYHFTALQICTTGITKYTTDDSYNIWTGGDRGKTYSMNGSLYLAFLTAGSDPTFAVPQPWDSGFWINTMQYGVHPLSPGNRPAQFYPPLPGSDTNTPTPFDINTCTQYACQDDQPCAFWGNAGSPWVPFDDANSEGAFTWWNDTYHNNYGPGSGYTVLDYVSQEQTLNERGTANTRFDCKRATQPPCTDVAGIVVNYLYDCVATSPTTLPAPGGKQYNSGLNNYGWGDDCGHNNNGAIGILLEAVKLYYKESDIRALTTQPIYCNDYNNSPDICVFYRGVATGNGSTTYNLLNQMHSFLVGDSCGSIGVEYPEYNVEAYGFLTVGQMGQDCISPTNITVTKDGVTGTAYACKGFPYS
ncbi:hypothetical protein HO133_004418 [Letharia lupina]|uniref:Uncharacterized protein n=1 Tax=Letharia lupina TaxID=560253 RepID=A0A8H6FK70_9LECA|nr:uncharacterized protein HO133_004418 [Letharia lupina]KAF6230079.1 hypothetical protein HO133_004418 [Letharia lupina]